MDVVDKSITKMRKNAILGIFAKQPIIGQCKTRLCPPLDLREAATFYECSLRETVSRMQQLDCCDLAICYAGERSWFEAEYPEAVLVPQQGEDIGARMAAALNGFLQQGYRQAVLIGSDSPDLPLELIEQACVALEEVEVVLAPASDGGYVLVGESQHQPQLFNSMAWSTEEVLAETLRRVDQSGIDCVQLQGWEDLDDLPALQRFLLRSPDSVTAAHLRKHLNSYFQSAADL
ncbi:TIGR04282 family arsenosugar biosynthesis glycosyltransferase [Malonomonas rubra]|uniref:TIGR04282 family arsenosugar biosynthesis glycosyltransferase n=1 Tax=Malonomonas rubra TaxID=57040 RepID=UPI001114B357|nr:TIGR04282 family arsenosugar biosynthesis glycosyltransferase [Malonomonas rubra]